MSGLGGNVRSPRAGRKKGNPSIFLFYQSLMVLSSFSFFFAFYYIMTHFMFFVLHNLKPLTALYKVKNKSIFNASIKPLLQTQTPLTNLKYFCATRPQKNQDFLISIRASLLFSSTKHKHTSYCHVLFFALCSPFLTHPPNQSFHVVLSTSFLFSPFPFLPFFSLVVRRL